MQTLSTSTINAIMQWDINSWSHALHKWEKGIDWNTVETGLELGAREGGLSLYLALKGKQTVCSDLMETQKRAEALHLKHGVENRIEYRDINAAEIPYENHFDVILFKSIIGGIGQNDNFAIQKQVFDQIYKALKPGGKLLFAENLVASPLHCWFRKKFTRWGGYWRYVTLDEMAVFLEDFQQIQMETTGFMATFGRSEKQRAFLSVFDRFIFNPILPKKWKYICYGIAQKPV